MSNIVKLRKSKFSAISTGIESGRSGHTGPTRIAALTCLLAVLYASTALGNDYFVEAVVFEWTDTQDQSATAERWKVAGRKPKSMPTPIRRLPGNIPKSSDKRILDQAVAQMLQNGSINVIKHQAWTQSRAGRSGSPQVEFTEQSRTQLDGWIRVYDSNLLYAEVNLALLDPDAINLSYERDEFSQPQTTIDNRMEQVESRKSRVVNRGGVTVTTDADGNVSFSNEGGVAGTASTANNQSVTLENAGPGATYRINERRRVKFKEIHYIDHPKFGVLLTLIRNEQS